MEYLTQIHDRHEEWLNTEALQLRVRRMCYRAPRLEAGGVQAGAPQAPVLILDANDEFEQDHSQRELLHSKLSGWLAGLERGSAQVCE